LYADRLQWGSNIWMGVSVEDDRQLKRIDHLRAVPAWVRFVSAEPLIGPLGGVDLTGISWLIAGGESGPGARPMDLDWVRSLRNRCESAGTAPFVKQLGSVWAQANGADSKGGDWTRWPEDLRIREYPRAAEAVTGDA
jgi:protein gp37